MPYPSTTCGRATLETASQPFQGWPIIYPFGYPPPYAYGPPVTGVFGVDEFGEKEVVKEIVAREDAVFRKRRFEDGDVRLSRDGDF
jgi:hypothetical protein